MANNIILSGGQVTMDVDFSTAKDQWFTGVISGTGSLRVIGEGFVGRALTLANANTFTGGVTLDTTTSAGAWIQLGNANGSRHRNPHDQCDRRHCRSAVSAPTPT